MKNFTDRFNKIIDQQAGGNKLQFSKQTGIPYTTVVENSNGKKKDPKLSMLVKIPNVNAEWLLTGSGVESIQKEVDSTSLQELHQQVERINALEVKLDALNVLILKQMVQK